MFFESMESRNLMSASAVSTAVTQDRANVKAALLQFRADLASKTATLMSDATALKAADAKQSSTLSPLFVTLHKDVKSMGAALKNDRLAEKSSVLADQSVIVSDRLKIREDKHNPTAVAADKHALLAEVVKLQDDELAGLNARITTRETDYTTIFNDITAITTAVGSDSGASASLVAAVNKFTADRSTTLHTLDTDLHTIVTDRTQLAADLMAMESSV